MSRGLGKIEQSIDSELRYGPLGSDELVRVVFEPSFFTDFNEDLDAYRAWRPSRSQRVATVRAMRSYVRKHPRYALAGGRGRAPLRIYDTEDKPSFTIAAAEKAASEFGAERRRARAAAKRARSPKGRRAAEAAAELAGKRKGEAEKAIAAARNG